MGSASSAIIGLVGGTVFILLGRWIYANPKKVYTSSLYANPDSPFLKFGVRLFATLLIFIGSYAAALWSVALVVHLGTTAVIIALVAALLGGWSLRPQVIALPHVAVGAPAAGTQKHGGFMTRKGRSLTIMALGISTVVFATILALFVSGQGRLMPVVAIVATLISALVVAVVLWFVK